MNRNLLGNSTHKNDKNSPTTAHLRVRSYVLQGLSVRIVTFLALLHTHHVCLVTFGYPYFYIGRHIDNYFQNILYIAKINI